MGDTLRRFLYPLVLPFVVMTVWTYASMMKAHAGQAAINQRSEEVVADAIYSPLPTLGNPDPGDGPASGYGFRVESDTYATAADDEQ